MSPLTRLATCRHPQTGRGATCKRRFSTARRGSRLLLWCLRGLCFLCVGLRGGVVLCVLLLPIPNRCRLVRGSGRGRPGRIALSGGGCPPREFLLRCRRLPALRPASVLIRWSLRLRAPLP